ncbi:IS481 family transposase [Streptomyces sp. NBC_00193]|uniref:IS481 family transposase n=1 Tax=Streptomyces sp. NBC_00193 TaxID=2975675 RepID=UPI00224CD365|nr:IS481 family transposase [Streptomyces sp. NBC_00193]MCX5299539.1 IS481 family transposase [Streptomyces sp. NBC_00193]MCX5301545.1 IS481 family transposase [Streptomyces sp. NBC_00193]MCX5301560.1 IS481 family transposase [Streptomyces sp. NBC_00193]MCX5301692.1 IS481 family transposase [Streptomyces sp. NBC_00193]
MSHRNARLTVHGRRILVERVLAGRPVAHVAAEMGISRPTAHKWVRRWRTEGHAGLHDRSSRPRTTPHRTRPAVEARVCELRRSRKLGPARIGPILGLPASTVHRILTRHGLGRLAWLDRPTGEPIRRYERARPGELVHVDIKKLGNIPDGGGWRVVGRAAGDRNRQATTDQRRSSTPVIGYSYIHSAVDDHSRLAYSEVLANERKETATGFWQRANAFFAAHGITVERVLTDNGACYKSKLFTRTLTAAGIAHKRTRPYRPQTNGKVERFNRTLAEEWAYQRPYASNHERTEALTDFLHTYNHHRCHTALGGHPPISRVNNAAGQYT